MFSECLCRSCAPCLKLDSSRIGAKGNCRRPFGDSRAGTFFSGRVAWEALL